MLLKMCPNLERYVANNLRALVKLISAKIDISVARRPPSRGPIQSQNPNPQVTRESVYIHKVSFSLLYKRKHLRTGEQAKALTATPHYYEYTRQVANYGFIPIA